MGVRGSVLRRLLDPWVLGVGLAVSVVLGVMVWQAVTSGGAPDPTSGHLSPAAVVLDSGILVFREGLEAILVLAAITASLTRRDGGYWRPISVGSVVAIVASVVTWFVVVAVISAVNAPALDVQAATGLLAIVVLLVIMNWFFHKIYWTGWIGLHQRGKRRWAQRGSAAFLGLAFLGFTAVYREGFEVVLFLQSLRLRAGTEAVLNGTAIGLGLTAVVAVLTFLAHRKLPYKKMLILTGVMLGGVLVVMVGESVQEMQLAHWLPTTSLGFSLPEWFGIWFAVFPNLQGLASQVLAAALVIGSYIGAQYVRVWRPRRLARQRSQTAAG